MHAYRDLKENKDPEDRQQCLILGKRNKKGSRGVSFLLCIWVDHLNYIKVLLLQFQKQ